MSGAPSDERSGLSFVLVTWTASVQFSKFAAGPRQLSIYLWFFWTYFFDPEDGDDMSFGNVGWNSTDYTASYPPQMVLFITAVKNLKSYMSSEICIWNVETLI
jgi:hypothetical protein